MKIKADKEGRDFIRILVDLARRHVAFEEVPVLYNAYSGVEEIKEVKEEETKEDEEEDVFVED